jgi:hypothetical protein
MSGACGPSSAPQQQSQRIIPLEPEIVEPSDASSEATEAETSADVDRP